MGGSNRKDNLVELTPREHFICHLLLTKMTSGKDRAVMMYTFKMMSGKKLYNSKQYVIFKNEYSKLCSDRNAGSNNPMYGRNRSGINAPMFGKKHSDETKKQISTKLKGRPATQKGENSHWHGTSGIFNQMSLEWQNEQRKRSSSLRNSEVHFCSFCHKTIKTNANWYKHLKIKHNYTDEDIKRIKS